MSPAPPPGWEGILDEGERILWQGTPAAGLRLSGGIVPSLFGLVFTAFSLFWIVMAARITDGIGLVGAVFPLFGLPFLAVGLHMLAGRFLWDAWVRRHTFYTLTDRAAYIATTTFGQRRLHSFGIDADSGLELVQGPPDSVYFTAGARRIGTRRLGNRVGFEHIEDGRRVFDLLRTVQKGTA